MNTTNPPSPSEARTFHAGDAIPPDVTRVRDHRGCEYQLDGDDCVHDCPDGALAGIRIAVSKALVDGLTEIKPTQLCEKETL